jgi:glycosyltransferase involved in cell wall biosynthesis
MARKHLTRSSRARPFRTSGPILHVIPFLWSGAGAVVTRLCEDQARDRRVAIVTTGASDGMSDWPAYRRRLARAGVTHHAIDFFHRDGPVFWGGVERLTKLLQRLEPAVIHAHAGVPAAACAIARDITGRRPRLIGQMYSWGPNRPAWMDTQDMWGLARADRVVCSARAYWDLLVEHGVPRSKLIYLPWGLPLEELPFRGSEEQKPEAQKRRSSGAQPERRLDEPVLGFVGRIEPRKNQVALVETLALVRRRFPTATLELVGPVADEAYARELRATIERHELGDAVTLHDRVPTILPFLHRWDAFVSLSSDEGQGLAVLEAMAVGVPVVARSVAGIEDFLADGVTGFSVGRAGARAAATVLGHALNAAADRRRVAKGARRLIERRYNWTTMRVAFDRLYDESLRADADRL